MSDSPTQDLSWRQRALDVFPGGSNGEYGIPADRVPVLARGQGSRVWDTEGREWLDMTMAWGSALIGHGHPEVLQAATQAAQDGFNFAAVNRRGVELAERLISLVPCAERVRFVASGTEATLLCIRVARAATGRPKILKFEGAYHGQHPIGITSMLGGRPSKLPQADSSGAGAPWVERDVLVAPFNDARAVGEILSAHAHELAGVIVEPIHRCIIPRPGFLEELRERTRRHGIVLIFDEVVTGFRLALGGAQEYYGVVPDLVAYGKALGGGFPIGAFAGRRDLMEVVNEERIPGPGYAWSASTTGGNPVSCAAAMTTLEVLSRPGVYPALHTSGRRLRQRMSEVLGRTEITAQVLGDGPLAQIAFSAEPVTDQRSWLASNRAWGRSLMLDLLGRQVFLNPLGTKLYLSLAHSDEDIDLFAERLREALLATRSAAQAGSGNRRARVSESLEAPLAARP